MDSILVNIGIVAFIILICVSVAFVVSHFFKDNSIMDMFYGPIFFATAYIAQNITDVSGALLTIITVCIALWATRLGTRIFLKNAGHKEDARYAKWREEWSKRGRLYFILRSYLQVNLLQGLIILGIMMPFIIAFSSPSKISLVFAFLGFIVFAAGLSIESLADWQLDKFIARKKAGTETATLMTKGLFAYSRRPNYFGETLIWWGLAIMVLPLPFGWLALISPILITYIVTKVTGPMLEQQFLERYGDEYRNYMKTTSYFIPKKPKLTPPITE
jgi:steroid 5-alpha reductase family enzyme